MTAQTVAVGDLDGDGRLDIVASGSAPGGRKCMLFLNEGKGAFECAREIAVEWREQIETVVADLDGDGDQDMAVAADDTLAIAINEGGASFSFPARYPTPVRPGTLAAADLDGDGDIDAAAIDAGSDRLLLFRNNGSGIFTVSGSAVVGEGACRLLAHDADGDGDQDLIVAVVFQILLLENEGGFRFSAETPLVDAGVVIHDFAMADLTGNGRLDIVTAHEEKGVRVFLSHAPRIYALGGTLSLDDRVSCVEPGDFDDDGIVDVAAVTHTRGVAFLRNDGSGALAPSQYVAFGKWPYDAAVGDLDGDGDDDLAVAGNSSRTVGVLLSRPEIEGADCDADGVEDAIALADGAAMDCNGNGVPDACDVAPILGFPAPQVLSIGAQAYTTRVAAGDFDGDRRDDLAGTFREDAGDLLALFRHGKCGRLEEFARHPLTSSCLGLAAADFDGDGSDDVAALQGWNTAGSMMVFRRLGNGTPDKAEYATGGEFPKALVAGRVNGDGAPDIVVAHDEDVTLFVNDGAGGFAAGVRYPTGRKPIRLALADVDGNGANDIVLGTVADLDGEASVMLNAGDGSFEAAVRIAALGVPYALALDDIDADGDPDLLAVAHPGAEWKLSSLQILLNDGRGTFSAHREVPAGHWPEKVLMADVNGDGVSEAVIASMVGVTVLAGLAPGGGDASTTYQAGPALSDVAAGDFDGDGDIDMAAAVPRRSEVVILANKGDGTFAGPVCLLSDSLPIDVAVGDVDADGRIDLVAADEKNSVFVLHRNRGGGTFGPAEFIAGGTLVNFAACVDLDGDGALDIAGRAVFLNRGDGTFGDPLPPIPTIGDRRTFADFDGDGDLDLARGEPNAGGAVILVMNDGGAAFVETGRIETGLRVKDVCSADFDGDGDMDIGVGGIFGEILILTNDGSCQFVKGARYTPNTSASTISAYDQDGDGDIDIVTTGVLSDCVALWHNRGDATFHPPLYFGVEQAYEASWGDIDGDGLADLATWATGGLALLRNRGDGRFAGRVRRVFGEGISPRMADFDGDGRADLAWIAGSEDRTITVFMNEGAPSFDSDENRDGIPDACKVFRRGDSTADSKVNIADAVASIRYVFGAAAIPCPAAGDMDDDGRLDAGDAVLLLMYLFGGGSPPPAPYSRCGADPTWDPLPCPRPAPCVFDR